MGSRKQENLPFTYYIYRAQLPCRRLFGLHLSNPDPMNYRVVLWLIILSVGLGVALLASNLAAIKIWDLGGIPVDGGIWLFPITYVLGDLLVEIYGEKVANIVAMSCAGFTVIVVFVLGGVGALPDFPGVDNSGFSALRLVADRTFLASIAGFLSSQIVNNHVFTRVRVADLMFHRNLSEGVRFYRRAFVSSLVAHAIDTLIFETLAFYGRISISDFLLQASFAYIAGVILEIPLSLVTRSLMKCRLCNLHYNDGKIQRN